MSEDAAMRMAINELYASINVDVDDWEVEDWPSGADPLGYRRYSQTDGSRSTAIIVSEGLARDAGFPLEQFLRREFAERLAHQRVIEGQT